MPTIQEVCDTLEALAPSRLAEDWDNVGLLVGTRSAAVRRLMTCLTVTIDSAEEAVAEGADLIVAHHPMPFRPLARLTDETTPGRLLLKLIASGVAVYSPHTAFDSAGTGINQRLAEGLQLNDIRPLQALEGDPDGLGAGRYGKLLGEATLRDVAARLKLFLGVDRIKMVGIGDRHVDTIAVACGSAGHSLHPAHQIGCQVLITGETNFHTCLEAQATGMSLLLAGHYASERFAVEQLAQTLQVQFANVNVWCSRREADPLQWV